MLFPVAAAARQAGHRVRVATSAALSGLVEEWGLTPIPLSTVVSLDELRNDPELAERYRLPQELTHPDRHTTAAAVETAIVRAFAGPLAGVFADDLISSIGKERPDLIVRESAELGGYLAAESLGLPHAQLDTAPMSALTAHLALPALNEQRVRLGLPPVTDPAHPSRGLLAGFVPESWYPAELRLATAKYYRPPNAESVPLALDPTDRPTVYAGLGTLAPTLPGFERLITTIIAALGTLPVNATVALGADRLLADPVPDNVRLVTSLPQREFLRTCDLFISHAGFGAVQDSIATGVPMVALPLFSDQPANAARMAELGLAITLDPDRVTANSLADACTLLLADPQYGRRARSLTHASSELPGVDTLLADLETLARRAGVVSV
ncbi:glycosyltransferase [Amycolatopsis sp. cg5]|uniref:glycosyltransferase n=1 Tax=Amycolatopsis sp. cg5 TaxID=3238802 RepID=UPI0035236371